MIIIAKSQVAGGGTEDQHSRSLSHSLPQRSASATDLLLAALLNKTPGQPLPHLDAWLYALAAATTLFNTPPRDTWAGPQTSEAAQAAFDARHADEEETAEETAGTAAAGQQAPPSMGSPPAVVPPCMGSSPATVIDDPMQPLRTLGAALALLSVSSSPTAGATATAAAATANATACAAVPGTEELIEQLAVSDEGQALVEVLGRLLCGTCYDKVTQV